MSSLTILSPLSKSVRLLCELVVEVCLPISSKCSLGSLILHFGSNCSSILIVVADYSTSVRIFEALREKTENKTQYDAYCNELKPVREELGIVFLHFFVV